MHDGNISFIPFILVPDISTDSKFVASKLLLFLIKMSDDIQISLFLSKSDSTTICTVVKVSQGSEHTIWQECFAFEIGHFLHQVNVSIDVCEILLIWGMKSLRIWISQRFSIV